MVENCPQTKSCMFDTTCLYVYIYKYVCTYIYVCTCRSTSTSSWMSTVLSKSSMVCKEDEGKVLVNELNSKALQHGRPYLESVMIHSDARHVTAKLHYQDGRHTKRIHGYSLSHSSCSCLQFFHQPLGDPWNPLGCLVASQGEAKDSHLFLS